MRGYESGGAGLSFSVKTPTGMAKFVGSISRLESFSSKRLTKKLVAKV